MVCHMATTMIKRTRSCVFRIFVYNCNGIQTLIGWRREKKDRKFCWFNNFHLFICFLIFFCSTCAYMWLWCLRMECINNMKCAPQFSKKWLIFGPRIWLERKMCFFMTQKRGLWPSLFFVSVCVEFTNSEKSVYFKLVKT